ncbi:d6b30869-4623-4052-9d4f-a7ebd7efafeb-CDS [Sclerotinia trifoliorum]|uniref:D6b30869-4623-4052-9d4f-a7ebd7efafeb-CDS n=1 Tax=Sclerotinia trifoliorum TaxID=28548 RepID=A0A8H2ZQQ0_9HELO|nr:d6b30869-4623-4052-9d4f-a7ebd7efafeb-CDS [Sclerotinia trifoliorum]
MPLSSTDPDTPSPASRQGKPEPGTGNDTGANTDKPKTIPIKVVDQQGTEITFKIRRNKPLQKIIDAYCSHKEIRDQKMVRFTFDGDRVKTNDTADSLEMDEEGRIDVFLEQQGGGH